MPNLTFSFDEKLLKKSRKYARDNEISLNALIRQLLAKTVMKNSTDWLDECFMNMDKSSANSKGKKWSREDLYR